MKADLTRDTFHPLKHFARVLRQQGRVQLDADMNEQAAILLHYIQTLAADLIGPAGGPANNLGFTITPLTPDSPSDFQIGFGNYYVNGLLCQADFIPIAFSPTSTTNVFQVTDWSSDFEAATVPYYEVFDATPGLPPNPVPVQITKPQAAQNQITIQALPSGTTFPSFATPRLRRQITYLHQPDLVYQTTSAGAVVSPLPLPASGSFQVYLDVWERVITYAEDDSIREVALGGPDTAARSKVVWQVKFNPASSDCGTPPPSSPRGWLQARAKQTSASTNPCIINPNASYTGPENQLYRVEINRPGVAGTVSGTSATFKWSRENGSVVYPIESGGGTATVVLESLGRDDRFGLAEGSLVEAQDDRSVLLNNTPGTLLPVQGIDPTTLTVTLKGTPDASVGGDETLHPLLRRWDQTGGDPAQNGLTLDTDNCAFIQEGQWLTLEDGVQIQFQPADPVQSPPSNPTPPVNQYLAGDYWLIPARTATGDVEWPKVTDAHGNPETDANGNTIPVALPPHGITHYYAPLAVVTTSATGGVTVNDDCRRSFEPGAVPVAPANT